jgi:type I restriction enzyme R subunit
LPDVGTGMNFERFMDKARQFLRAHEDHLSLQRLRRNQPLTASDLNELERMLLEAGGTAEFIGLAREQSKGLGVFIRSLVGLDRDAVQQAFSSLLSGTSVSANQIEFVNLVIEELTRNGVMEPYRLYESPFTDLHTLGVVGIFPSTQADQLRDILLDIRHRAAA